MEHLTELAAQTDRGMALATALVERLRQQRAILPPINVIERVCAHALTMASYSISRHLSSLG